MWKLWIGVMIGAGMCLAVQWLAKRIAEGKKEAACIHGQPDEETLRRIREEARKAEQWEALMNYNGKTGRGQE